MLENLDRIRENPTKYKKIRLNSKKITVDPGESEINQENPEESIIMQEKSE